MGFYYDGICYEKKSSALSASVSGKFYVKPDGTPDFLFVRGQEVCTSAGCYAPHVAECEFINNEVLVYDLSKVFLLLVLIVLGVSFIVSAIRKI